MTSPQPTEPVATPLVVTPTTTTPMQALAESALAPVPVPVPVPIPVPVPVAPPAPGGVMGPIPGQRMQRRIDGPRRIKNGLRLRRKEATDNLPWPATTWLRLITTQISPEMFAEALDYAKAGQAASLVVTPGAVEAVIQGRAPRPYRTRIDVAQFTGNEWDRVVATMAAEAIWSAKLLSGELPQSIEILFRAIGKALVPETDNELHASCSCAGYIESPTGPCKHIVTAWMLASERIEADPLLSFTLRGLDGQRLLERLQEARTIATRGVARAHSTPPAAESATASIPVERCMQDFWRPGRRLSELEELVKDEHVPHALLRRLGPSPFQANANRAAHIQPAPSKGMQALPPAPPTQPMSKFPLVGLLASIYDSISLASKKLRDADTGESSAK